MQEVKTAGRYGYTGPLFFYGVLGGISSGSWLMEF